MPRNRSSLIDQLRAFSQSSDSILSSFTTTAAARSTFLSTWRSVSLP